MLIFYQNYHSYHDIPSILDCCWNNKFQCFYLHLEQNRSSELVFLQYSTVYRLHERGSITDRLCGFSWCCLTRCPQWAALTNILLTASFMATRTLSHSLPQVHVNRLSSQHHANNRYTWGVRAADEYIMPCERGSEGPTDWQVWMTVAAQRKAALRTELNMAIASTWQAFHQPGENSWVSRRQTRI